MVSLKSYLMLYMKETLFFYCNFDYDLLVESDLENKYENMKLPPPFPEKKTKGQNQRKQNK